MLNYHPAGVRLSRKEFQAAVAGKANADLIARYVQLGMPEHYLRPPRI
jgi:hypothetical protein